MAKSPFQVFKNISEKKLKYDSLNIEFQIFYTLQTIIFDSIIMKTNLKM